jgi:DNA topoisomerase-1
MPRLRRADCSGPGLRRVRRGRGFQYREEDETPIEDRETLEQIRELAIPPAWEDVWICPHPRGHIQATGYDAAGRKQYLYHQQWRENRDRQKFDEMLGLREGAARLDLGFFRIGSERYAAENESFGARDAS